MAAQASQAELNRFVKVVDEFKAKYARLILPATKAEVYATKNPAMIRDYENAVSRGGALNSTIANLVGAWAAFKSGYKKVTDATSTVIGDAIDEIRSWFGYDPSGGMGYISPSQAEGSYGGQKPYDIDRNNWGEPYSAFAGLGAVQIGAPIAAIAIAGVIAAALILINLMDKIFVNLQANRIQRENPNVSRGDALAQGAQGIKKMFEGGLTLPMIAAGAVALYFILGSKK